MFFVLSKIFWSLAAPSHVILWCAVLGALLLMAGRRRTGTGLAVAAAILLTGLGVVPSYVWLGRDLESRFDHAELPARADGILILGGGRENIYRVPAGFILSRRYPDARVVFSGGSGELLHNVPGTESGEAGRALLALGLDPKRITLEGRSRNTYENFMFTRAIVKPRPGEIWILVTSAYHMPRAMEIARKMGWTFIPATSDRRSPEFGFGHGWCEIPRNLDNFDTLTREYIGLSAYRLSGRSSG